MGRGRDYGDVVDGVELGELGDVDCLEGGSVVVGKRFVGEWVERVERGEMEDG